MKEEKTTQFAAKQDYLTEENLKEVAGAGSRPGWACLSCGRTFDCPPFNYKCDNCGGNVGIY